MKKLLIILFFFISIFVQGQIIDFNRFCEETMNRVMFEEMNKYIKDLHNGDSLTLSVELQELMMIYVYPHIKEKTKYKLYCTNSELEKLHYAIGKSDAFLMNKKSGRQAENLANLIYNNDQEFTYQDVANLFIQDWKNSPRHKWVMEYPYKNNVIVGIVTYYDKKRRTIYVSFMYVS